MEKERDKKAKRGRQGRQRKGGQVGSTRGGTVSKKELCVWQSEVGGELKREGEKDRNKQLKAL